jgi:hypothetical protein
MGLVYTMTVHLVDRIGSGELKYDYIIYDDIIPTKENNMSQHMERPEAAQAFKYKNQTFNTFEDALKEEFYDKLDSILTETGVGHSYLAYNKEAIKAGMSEIVSIAKEYDAFLEEQKHPSIQSPVHSASADYAW